MITKSPGIEKLLNEEAIENVPCPICNAEGKKQNDKIVASRGYPNLRFQNVICKDCGLTRINPRMTKKGYDRFYQEVFFEYLDPFNRPAYVEEFENTKNPKYWTSTRKNIMPYIYGWLNDTHKTALDIGAGYGSILYFLKNEKKLDCIGIDPDPGSRKIAKEKLDVEVLNETIESFFEKDKKVYDLIVLEQTYEHLLSPLWTLKEIKKRLSKEGMVYIGVPNGYKFGAPHYLYYQLAHTYNYTPYSFKKLAELSGLRVFDVRNPYGHPLEVMLCHPEANYPMESDSVLNVGKDYRSVLREVRTKQYLEFVRHHLRKLLVMTFGQNLKEKIRTVLDRVFNYKY